MKTNIFILAFVCILSILSSCNSSNHKCSGKSCCAKKETLGKEYTSKYICPMYCEGSGDATMGTCPVCKMDYELNEKFLNKQEPKSDHSHDKDHKHGEI